MMSPSEEDTSEPPFHRLQVGNWHRRPNSVDGISDDVLTAFLHRIVEAKQSEGVEILLGLLLGVFYFVMLMMLNFMPTSNYTLLVSICFLVFSILHWYLTTRNTKMLQQICKVGASTTLSDYTVEYHEELYGNNDVVTSPYIYLFPDRSSDGIVRVEVAKDPICSCKTSPSLPSYDSVPAELPPNVSVEEWSSFWERVDCIASTRVLLNRHFFAIGPFCLFYVLLSNLGDSMDDFVLNILWFVLAILGVLLILYMLYCTVQTNRTDPKLDNLCKEFSSSQNDLVVMYHKERDWSKTWWWLRSPTFAIRRSIWLYPKPQSQVDCALMIV